MDSEKPLFLHEIKKRAHDKPLTLGELSSLREIGYKWLKEDTHALELLIEFCKHRKIKIIHIHLQRNSKLESVRKHF